MVTRSKRKTGECLIRFTQNPSRNIDTGDPQSGMWATLSVFGQVTH
ncbi:MAG: hypothetical protein NC402_00860 [Prevotella sp.]|nr:hypothetical protein [Prevotella sp.]